MKEDVGHLSISRREGEAFRIHTPHDGVITVRTTQRGGKFRHRISARKSNRILREELVDASADESAQDSDRPAA
jgi:hypothetical protein